MGNCALKPATKEGEAPAPEEKPVESADREITLDTKVITTDVVDADDLTTPRSLAQMLEEEEKKAEGVEAVEVVKPVEEKSAESSEPPKVEETAPVEAVKVEEKKIDVVAN